MGFLTKLFQKKQTEAVTKTGYTPNDLYSDHKQIQEALTDIRQMSDALSEIEILNNDIAAKAEELAAQYVRNTMAVKAVKEELARLNLAMREIDADLGTITKISAKADNVMSLEDEINPYVSHIIDVMRENQIGTTETYISLKEQITNRRQDLLRAFYPKGYEQIQAGTSQTVTDYSGYFYASTPGANNLDIGKYGFQNHINYQRDLSATLEAAITHAKEQTESLDNFLQGKADDVPVREKTNDAFVRETREDGLKEDLTKNDTDKNDFDDLD